MPQNYYIAKVSPGPPCTFTYLDVSEKQVLMCDYRQNKNPPVIYADMSKGNAYIKLHKLKGMQCISESKFISKVEDAIKANALEKMKNEPKKELAEVQIVPAENIVSIPIETTMDMNEFPTAREMLKSPCIEAPILPSYKEKTYGEELCVPFCKEGETLPPATKGPALTEEDLFMRAASGHDIGDSQYAQLMLETLSTLEKLCYATQYIQKEVPEKITELEHQKNDEEEYAEYYRLDACRAFEFYKRFREIRLERRFWKDLLQVSKIVSAFIGGIDVDEINRIQNCIEAARGRVYRLRAPDEFVHTERVHRGSEETDPKNA